MDSRQRVSGMTDFSPHQPTTKNMNEELRSGDISEDAQPARVEGVSRHENSLDFKSIAAMNFIDDVVRDLIEDVERLTGDKIRKIRPRR